LLIVEVDVDRGARHLPDLHIAHVHVLDHAAADGVGLEAQHAIQVGAVHGAFLGEYVADIARALTPHRYAAVPVFHGAVAHHDVLAGRVQTAPVRVAAALDRDAIVARVERAAFDQHIDAGFGVAAIVVRAVAGDGHVA